MRSLSSAVTVVIVVVVLFTSVVAAADCYLIGLVLSDDYFIIHSQVWVFVILPSNLA